MKKNKVQPFHAEQESTDIEPGTPVVTDKLHTFDRDNPNLVYSCSLTPNEFRTPIPEPFIVERSKFSDHRAVLHFLQKYGDRVDRIYYIDEDVRPPIRHRGATKRVTVFKNTNVNFVSITVPTVTSH